MSEPQHPQPHDMDTHSDRPLSAAPTAVPTGFDSLAAVGARLAQLRESKGWSVEDVSARLKVSPGKLRGLEAGDLSQLPDTTFALGVVRSYAKMVGADPAPMTQALRREKGVPEPALTMPASAGTDLPRGKVSLSLGGGGAPRRRSWLWGVALSVVVLIALAMWHTNNGDSNAWLARLKGIAGGSASTGAASSVTGQPASGASVTGAVTGSASATQSATQADAPADTQAADAEGASSATPMPTPLPMAGAAPASNAASASAPAAAAPKAASAAPAVAAAASAAPASEPTAAPEGASTVALTVKQDSWFSVRQKDGKEVFSGLVHAGEKKEISGQAPLKVTVGNKAGLDTITLDGQPVDPAKYASAKGNVARFALP
ncbi:helix-turn-helix domain-containing protein [Paraburkholderia sp. Tr-20389]|uniref:helix-turn-helix domain-containing protein n=1 Tax=Paraburkholderia sp. Tr-20389 TaxID=2703903 RepID=UPI00197F2A40|nr:RodZ domain-containing protein [Paraburkholderia sp. Tr-20389]MBN3753371.1 helix-turn-helix domain-containing protein [Paraburkholderia sp. Tr-20389]